MNTVQKIRDKVFSYIEKHHILESGDSIVAGISGGADSVCLLLLLQEYRKLVPIELAVVHLNHGIREDAAEDARFVEKLCLREGIPFFLREEDVEAYAVREKCSPEDAGRRLRYRAFEEVAAKLNANKIAVAHNCDDRAETMLFHLFRGSGLKGLRGILPVRDQVIRPILCLERREIEAFLEACGESWCTDSTNGEDDYARNRIRHHILPYAEREICAGTVAHMCKTADLLAETEEYLAQETWEALQSCCKETVLAGTDLSACMKQELAERSVPEGGREQAKECELGRAESRIRLDVAEFRKYHPVLQKRMLLLVAEQLSPTGKDIEAVHISGIMDLFFTEGNREVNLPMGVVARRQYGSVILEKRTLQEGITDFVLPEIEMIDFFVENGQEVPKNQYTKWFDYDKMKKPPMLRFRQTGDFLTIADGAGGMLHKSLKDYMITEKIPREYRDKIPVLAEDNHVIWLIGYRISEYYKVDRNTKRVLQVKILEESPDGETEEKNVRTY